ncbi:predicted protein [Uncinocarpus reesii 1704]|uniref:RTA1 domain-containing protein n=1 Tax=Uncinocarpus reesii (strain UAMH 1704) TaxID=336963 RepID=C4JZ10_UNCRE|nr:uncharacterized protein UREG_07411 [Uncinocarpus reesii 1704]EEP82546.1 predicted protein [Uncinocarpus reesii 1704]
MTNRCEGVDFSSDDIPWAYCPSFPAAVLFAALFFLLTVTHAAQAFLFRKRLRSLGPYIPAQILIILAPLWLNAFIYMVLGRMIYFFLPEQKCFGISAKRLTLIFVILDVTAFLVQGSASSLLSSDDPNTMNIGKNLYMGGIGVQEFFILVFVGLAIRFHYKMTYVEAIHPPSYPWRPLLYCVYAGLALITIRIIYRLCEYAQGVHTPLAKNEAAFYVLDATTMVIALFLFNIVHPGRFLVGPESEFPKKEKKDKKKEKEEKKALREAERSKKRKRSWRRRKEGDLEADGDETSSRELGNQEFSDNAQPGLLPEHGGGYH